MTDRKLTAWWSHKQGLDGSLEDNKSPAAILETTGWARTVGGAGPYLSLFARAGLPRAVVDAALANLEIHELPSVRGCTYLLPASDFALGLKAAQAFSGAEMKVAAKLGVTQAEVDKLCEAVLTALRKMPLDPEALKQAVGPAVRSLGPDGVKKGIASTMPLALGQLQVMGNIRRVPINGRLDQQRYRYTLWQPNPLAEAQLSPEKVNVEIARRYFRWIGPATLAEFQWHSGLGVKAAKAAVEPLKLVPFDKDSDRWMFAEDREAFEQFDPPQTPQYVLTSNLDGVILLRRDLKGLVTETDLSREVMDERGPKPLSGLADLPSPGIFDRGRIVGLWEYDGSTTSIVWWPFVKPDKALERAVTRMQAFVKDELGDARAFSLDSPKTRVPRIEGLRKAASAQLAAN